MAYADVDYYQNKYLLGRAAVVPLQDFDFWEKRARGYIDEQTLNRIEPSNVPDAVRECVCELAEFFYSTEGIGYKQSENSSGYSVTYKHDTEKRIVQKHLSSTGLLYRGV